MSSVFIIHCVTWILRYRLNNDVIERDEKYSTHYLKTYLLYVSTRPYIQLLTTPAYDLEHDQTPDFDHIRSLCDYFDA